jgi:hypothetical protein
MRQIVKNCARDPICTFSAMLLIEAGTLSGHGSRIYHLRLWRDLYINYVIILFKTFTFMYFFMYYSLCSSSCKRWDCYRNHKYLLKHTFFLWKVCQFSTSWLSFIQILHRKENCLYKNCKLLVFFIFFVSCQLHNKIHWLWIRTKICTLTFLFWWDVEVK